MPISCFNYYSIFASHLAYTLIQYKIKQKQLNRSSFAILRYSCCVFHERKCFVWEEDLKKIIKSLQQIIRDKAGLSSDGNDILGRRSVVYNSILYPSSVEFACVDRKKSSHPEKWSDANNSKTQDVNQFAAVRSSARRQPHVEAMPVDPLQQISFVSWPFRLMTPAYVHDSSAPKGLKFRCCRLHTSPMYAITWRGSPLQSSSQYYTATARTYRDLHISTNWQFTMTILGAIMHRLVSFLSPACCAIYW